MSSNTLIIFSEILQLLCNIGTIRVEKKIHTIFWKLIYWMLRDF